MPQVVKLNIQRDSRQIPKVKQFLSKKKYCDSLYAYLQSISHWDGKGQRYVYKKDVNFTDLAEMFGTTRQTISKKFKFLLEGQEDSVPLIRYDQKNKRYYLIQLDRQLAALVPRSTLIVLVSTLKQNVISLYVYLLNRYYASGCNEFQFSYPQLKTVLGLGTKSSGNNYLITSYLFVLQKLGLLNKRSELRVGMDGQKVTVNYITWMTNEISGLPEDLNKESGVNLQIVKKLEDFC